VTGVQTCALPICAITAATLLGGCQQTTDPDTTGIPGGNLSDAGDINFSDINANATQEQVTGIIKSSLELLQAQTQNIINKLTETKTGLQQQLAAATPGTANYDSILLRINNITTVIDYENIIMTAQKNRYTEEGLNAMRNNYSQIINMLGTFLGNSTDKDLLNKKVNLYQNAVYVDERNFITNEVKANIFNDMRLKITDIKNLEAQKGNENYYLPDPETDMYNLRLTLQSEVKQILSSNKVLGEHGERAFYQGCEDFSQYWALLGDAYTLGKNIDLP
jgi:hypothetical protein